MRRSADVKTSVEEAALRLFVTKGVAETSIRDIAREAGVSLGAMYNHYTSKDELAWHLFSASFSRIGVELRRRAQEEHGIKNQIRAMISYIFSEFDRDWLRVSFVFLARHQHMNRVTPDLGNPYIAFRFVIAEAIRRAEIPRQNAELSTSLVAGAIIQTIDSRILRRIKRNLAELTDPVASACVRLLHG